MPLSPIPDILDDLRAGRMIILVDDEDRENEGDLVCAAANVSPEAINFMLTTARGYMCLSLAAEDCDRLDLHPQAAINTSLRGTPLTVAIDGHPKHGVGTGVSAKDRARTIQLAINPATTPDDFVRPGHINPLRSRDGGVLVRTGQTEGSVDLARMAGLHPSAVIIEIVREDGEMARLPDLEILAEKHDLKLCSVEQIITHRLERERLLERIDPVDGTMIETPFGVFNLIAYHTPFDPVPHLALTVGGVGILNGSDHATPSDEPALVRMHRRDLLGDIFDEASNPSGHQLRKSLRMIHEAGRGALVYLRPEGSGTDWRDRLQRIKRPASDDVNAPDLTRPDGIAGKAQPMDKRDIGVGSQILHDLGLRKLRVLTNHPRTMHGLSGFGLEIVEHVPISD